MDWIIMALNLGSYFMIATLRIKWGLIVASVSCILGIVYFGVMVHSVPLTAMNGAFLAINILSFIRWTK